MNQDALFQVVLAVGFLIVVTVTLNHRLKSWKSKETLDRRQEGVFILATLRPVGLAVWLGIIAYMINPAWMAWSSVSLPVWLRWMGAGLCVVAAGLLDWTLRSLGPNLTDTVVTRQVHTLVTHGPYRWVRHPFYNCVMLFIIASSLMAANWFLFAAGCAFFCLVAIRTRTEEALLLARFGDAYRTYLRQTGRFVPRWP